MPLNIIEYYLPEQGPEIYHNYINRKYGKDID